MDRVVALVDMDCFYVQVEQRLQPEYKGKPCAVVQYKTWKGGGIIAVGYEARACGVTRNMWGDDAKKLCPDIHFFRVPEYRGKADLTKFRDAGKEVINLLSRFSSCVERASIDEAYIDLTEEVKRRLDSRAQQEQLQNTFIVGHDKDVERAEGLNCWLDLVYEGDDFNNIQDKKLAVGAMISEEMRAAVYEETGFRCSAGIAHNKMLAKLACGIHKPNKQTILPHGSVPQLFSTLPVRKIRNLGGKLGESLVEDLNVEFMGDLVKFSLAELQQNCGDKTGHWIYEVCRGIEHEPVSARQLPKSIGCSKNFPGKTCLDTKEKVQHWLKELSEEVVERLEKDRDDNNRSAKSLTVSVRYMSAPSPVSVSRACAVVKYDAVKFADDAFTLIQKLNTLPLYQSAWSPPIICLGISAGKFVEFQDKNQSNISAFLGKKSSTTNTGSSPLPINNVKLSKGSIQSFFKSKDNMSDKPQEKLTKSSENKVAKGSIQTFFKNSVTKDNAVVKDINSQFSEDCIINIEEPSSSNSPSTSKNGTSIENKSGKVISDSHLKNSLLNNTEVSSKKSGFFANKLQKGSASSDVVNISENCCDSVKSADDISTVKSSADDISTVKFSADDISIVKSSGDDISSVKFSADDISTARFSGNDISTVKSEQKFNDQNSTLEVDADNESDITSKHDIDIELKGDNSMDVAIGDEEFDEDVFMSLPSDIQHEIRANMKPKENKKQKDKNRSSLDKFFNQNLNKMSENKQTEDMSSCEKCGKVMLVWELPEHLDFHFAQEIQKELRQEDTLINRMSTKRKSDVTSPNKSKKKFKKTENVNKLTSFFSKK